MNYGLRVIHSELPAIGEKLENSWHPADACDWLTEDQELPGSCCFLMRDNSPEAEQEARGWADCYWPGAAAVVIAGRLVPATEYGGLPEDGAGVLADAVVVRVAA